MSIVPLDPFSVVVDERRKWTPEWYQWLQDLSKQVTAVSPPPPPPPSPPPPPPPPLDWIKFTHPAQLRAGLNPISFNGQYLFINPGTIADLNGTFVYSSNQNSLPHFLKVSQTSIGAWTPADEAIVGTGHTELLGGMIDSVAVDGDSIFLLIVARDSDNHIELMGSKALYSGTPPSGWHVVRHLPYMFKYRTVWGGLPDFFTGVSGDNRVLYSKADLSGTWLLGGPLGGTTAPATPTSGTFNAFASGVVGSPNVTMLMSTRVSMNPANVSAGTAGFSAGAGSTAFPVGQVNAGGDNAYGEVLLRSSTSGTFNWFTTGGAQLAVYLKGHWFEEPV